MKKYSFPILFFYFIASLTFANSKHFWHWENLVALIGNPIDSKLFQDFESKAGTMKKSTYLQKQYLNFSAQGICLEISDGKILGVFLQIAPGKSIDDLRYHGSLPFNIDAIRSEPIQAIKILGKPMKQEGEILFFKIEGFLFKFIYQPQLDFIRIYNEKA